MKSFRALPQRKHERAFDPIAAGIAGGTKPYTVKSLRGESGELIGRSGVGRVYAADSFEVGRVLVYGVGGVAVVPAITDILHKDSALDVVGAHQFEKHRRSAVELRRIFCLFGPGIMRVIDPNMNVRVNNSVLRNPVLGDFVLRNAAFRSSSMHGHGDRPQCKFSAVHL